MFGAREFKNIPEGVMASHICEYTNKHTYMHTFLLLLLFLLLFLC